MACPPSFRSSLEVDWQRLEELVTRQITTLSKVPSALELEHLKRVKFRRSPVLFSRDLMTRLMRELFAVPSVDRGTCAGDSASEYPRSSRGGAG